MSEAVYVPRFLNERERVLIFDMIELVTVLGFFGVGIAFKSAGAGIVLGITGFLFSRWCKRRGYFEILPNILYGYLPEWLMRVLHFKLQGTPPAHFRMLTG